MTGPRVAIVGGGILGLATAYKLSQQRPDATITVLEKEEAVARHQTGRNSGVIHSGIYYKPGSNKALMCRNGKAQLEAFCRDHGIAMDRCGKVVVAISESEIPALDRIHERGIANGVECRRISVAELKDYEPHCAGVDALHVPETGIVDYVGICEKLAGILRDAGHHVLLGRKVTGVEERADTIVLATSHGDVSADFAVNCAGLFSDRLVAMCGRKPSAKIVPFRGEYFELTPDAHHLCRNLIYPVPDPNFPFLGVHLTRMVLGGVECGPNAVLAFAREGYYRTTLNMGDLAETLSYSGFIHLAKKHWRNGMGEMWRSFSKAAFVRALQRLVPELRSEQLTAAEAGVRAQAVLPDGSLVDDFLFEDTPRFVHVVNAPSPAATACLAIADHIVGRLEERLESPSKVYSGQR